MSVTAFECYSLRLYDKDTYPAFVVAATYMLFCIQTIAVVMLAALKHRSQVLKCLSLRSNVSGSLFIETNKFKEEGNWLKLLSRNHSNQMDFPCLHPSVFSYKSIWLVTKIIENSMLLIGHSLDTERDSVEIALKRHIPIKSILNHHPGRPRFNMDFKKRISRDW